MAVNDQPPDSLPAVQAGNVEEQAGAQEQAIGQRGSSTASTSSSSSIRNSQLNPGLGTEEKDEERFIVKWDGPDDPGCPLNTPVWRKWYVPDYSYPSILLSVRGLADRNIG
jgi:hypothetical protein